MSTTITNAYQLEHGVKLPELADTLRELLTPMIYHEMMSSVFANAAYVFDLRSDYSTPLELCVSNEIDELFSEPDGEKNTEYKLVLFHDKEDLSPTGEPRYYMMLVQGLYKMSSEDLNPVILGIEGVAGEYDYWNGSDSQLDYLTEAEWKARGDLWRRLIPRNTDIRLCGLTVHLTSYFETKFQVTLQNISEEFSKGHYQIPNDEKRTRRRISALYMQSLLKNLPPEESSDFIAQNFMSFLGFRSPEELPAASKYPDLVAEAVKQASVDVKTHPIVF